MGLSSDDQANNTPEKKSPPTKPVTHSPRQEIQPKIIPVEPVKVEAPVAQPADVPPSVPQGQWSTVLSQLQALQDPLLQSIFVQGRFEGFDNNKVSLGFSEKHTFFQDWLKDTQRLWKPIINNVFGENAELVYAFKASIKADAVSVEQITPVQIKVPVAQRSEPEKKKTFGNAERHHFQKAKPKEKIIIFDVSDEKWKTAQLLLKYFPGTIQLVGET
jgi:hypothetical protein